MAYDPHPPNPQYEPPPQQPHYQQQQPPPYPQQPPPYPQQPPPYPQQPANYPPPGWPPPAAPGPPPRRRTGLVIGLVAGGLVLVLCLGGIAGIGIWALSGEESSEASPSQPVDPTAAPDGDPAAGGDPFAASPAATFAEGADGIALPEPRQVGDFSADQVADALAQVRDAMVAARIEQTMLVERDPEPFLALMSPHNQSFLRDDFESGAFGYFATQLVDGAQLAVPSPRVEGEITYEATTDSEDIRVIEIVTSFVWAYAFEVPGNDPELDGIVVVRDELVWHMPAEDDVLADSAGLWLWEGEAYAWGIDCDAFDQSLIGPQTEPGDGIGGPPDDESEIYDPDGSLDIPDTC